MLVRGLCWGRCLIKRGIWIKSGPIYQASRRGTNIQQTRVQSGPTWAKRKVNERSICDYVCYRKVKSWLNRPAGPLPLDPSRCAADRLRLCCLRFPPVERAARMCTLLILKKATMKGCFSSAPLRPMRPASLELMLSPESEDKRCSW